MCNLQWCYNFWTGVTIQLHCSQSIRIKYLFQVYYYHFNSYYRFSVAMDSGTLTALEIDPELEPDQEPLPELEPLPKPESLVEMCEPQSQPDPIPTPSLTEFGTMTFDDQQKDRKRRVSTAIEELLVVDENMQKFLEYVKADRVIVDVEKIVELFEGQCSEVGCSAVRKVVEKKLEAGVLLITHKCSKGHSGIWSSSSVLGEKRGQKINLCVICVVGFFSSCFRKQF